MRTFRLTAFAVAALLILTPTAYAAAPAVKAQVVSASTTGTTVTFSSPPGIVEIENDGSAAVFLAFDRAAAPSDTNALQVRSCTGKRFVFDADAAPTSVSIITSASTATVRVNSYAGFGGSPSGADRVWGYSLPCSTTLSVSTDLYPSGTGQSLGTAALPWQYVFFYGTSATPATNHFKFVGASTGGERTITFPDASITVPSNTLNNLGTVALNVPLLPDAAAADDFGSATLPFKDLWFAGGSGTPATNNFKITGTSTSGTRTITFPDASITVTGNTLANLGTTAINNILQPGTAGALDFGSATKPWGALWFAGTSGTPATNNFSITGASTGGTRTITAPDADTKLPIAAQVLTFAGPTGARTVTLPDVAFTAAGLGVAQTFTAAQSFTAGVNADAVKIPLVADAIVQEGAVVMVDAGTDMRFDANTGSAASAIGIYNGSGAAVGSGATAAGTSYNITVKGIGVVAIAEDQAVTLGHYLVMSATAGYATDSASVGTVGLNLAMALESSPVTFVIDPTGCGSSCVNTTSETITLSSAPGWSVGDRVVYWNSGGTTLPGLVDGSVYFIKTISGADVTLAETFNGAAVNLTGAGDDATQYLQKLPRALIGIR